MHAGNVSCVKASGEVTGKTRRCWLSRSYSSSPHEHSCSFCVARDHLSRCHCRRIPPPQHTFIISGRLSCCISTFHRPDGAFLPVLRSLTLMHKHRRTSLLMLCCAYLCLLSIFIYPGVDTHSNHGVGTFFGAVFVHAMNARDALFKKNTS